jgi:prevent-host-death family protein
MKTVTIRELHAKTGEVVRAARIHGEILITDSGRAVARILPESAAVEMPYFAKREPSKAFSRLQASGKTGVGTDATAAISEEREDRA